jgi:hypothetical protein
LALIAFQSFEPHRLLKLESNKSLKGLNVLGARGFC